MISMTPTIAAPDAAGRANANGARAAGDAFASKLQRAVSARQPAARPNDDRMPADDRIEQDSNDSNEPTDAETKASVDKTTKVDTTPRGDDDGTAATVTAGAAAGVVPAAIATAAPASPPAVPAASTAPTSPPAGAAASAAEPPVPVPSPASPSSASGAASAPSPAAVAATAAVPVNGKPAPVAAMPRSADDAAQAAVTDGLVTGNALVAKGSRVGDADTGGDSKRRRDGAARDTAVAAGGHLVGPAEVIATGNVANRAGERVGPAPVTAEPAATTAHADHQAVARAADVLTTGEHAGPMTTNRLSLEMDGSGRVAVRMDNTGRFVRVDVLADPTGRLDSAWRADMSEGLRNHGLELDQRGADTKGEGHHREDKPDDRSATDGGLPRKPVLSRPARPGSLWL